MPTSPIPIKFCTWLNLRRLRSRLTKGRAGGIGAGVRLWGVLLAPPPHPPLFQGSLLVLAQRGLRWLPAPPLQQVFCSLPPTPGPAAVLRPLVCHHLWCASLMRVPQPRGCHPSRGCPMLPPSQAAEQSKIGLCHPHPLFSNFLQKENGTARMREAWATQRNGENRTVVQQWFRQRAVGR